MQFPASVCVRITRRCNAACSFCQAPNTSPAQLTRADIVRLAEVLRVGGVHSLKLSGGEPTIRPDLPDMLDDVANQHLKPVVITNGIEIGAKLIAAATRTGAEFKLSVHRPDSSNDGVLRVRSFDRIAANMRALVDHCVPFGLNTVVGPGDGPRLAAMVKFAASFGARKISFIPVVPRGRAALKSVGTVSTSELTDLLITIRSLAARSNKTIDLRIIDIRARDYWVVENDGALWIERSAAELDSFVMSKAELLDPSQVHRRVEANVRPN